MTESHHGADGHAGGRVDEYLDVVAEAARAPVLRAEAARAAQPEVIQPPEISAGLKGLLQELAYLSIVIDVDNEDAQSGKHPDITYSAKLAAETGTARLEGAIKALDLAIPRPDGSWLEEVDRLKTRKAESDEPEPQTGSAGQDLDRYHAEEAQRQRRRELEQGDFNGLAGS